VKKWGPPCDDVIIIIKIIMMTSVRLGYNVICHESKDCHVLSIIFWLFEGLLFLGPVVEGGGGRILSILS
jgi:hypothetical protein